MPAVPSNLALAWAALHFAKPPGWYVGNPTFHNERNEWQLFAYDPLERAVDGVRRREWTAVAATQEAVVREMARCLRQISTGRIPRQLKSRRRPRMLRG
jgi:hypothetical protein